MIKRIMIIIWLTITFIFARIGISSPSNKLVKRKPFFGMLYYTGKLEKNLFVGFGEIKFKNGDIYRGFFFKGRFHGNGKYVSKNKYEYMGEFEEGKAKGEGLLSMNEIKYKIKVFKGELIDVNKMDKFN